MASQLDYLKALDQKLEEARPAMERFDTHYENEAPMSFLSKEVSEAFANLKELRLNWCRLAVDVLADVIEVEGFALGPGEGASHEIWDTIWEPSNMSEASAQAQLDSLIHGRAFLLVWGEGDVPKITAESALQCYVQLDPGTGHRLRGLKRWKDADAEHYHAFLYEPTEITRWQSEGMSLGIAGSWKQVESIRNPLGAVPLIPLVNRPRLMRPLGTSELVDIVGPVESIARLCTDMSVAAAFASMQRRWATGITIEEEPVLDDQGNPVLDEDTGQPMTRPATQFDNTAARVWLAENPEAQFGQFSESDLRGFIASVQLLTNAVAMLAGLPPNMVALAATTNPASAEALRAASQGLVSKAHKRIQSWSGPYEDAVRLALAIQHGAVPEDAARLQTLFKDPESKSPAVMADAATKLVQAGIVPPDQAQIDLGYSPQEREAMRQMRRQAAVDQAVVQLEEAS